MAATTTTTNPRLSPDREGCTTLIPPPILAVASHHRPFPSPEAVQPPPAGPKPRPRTKPDPIALAASTPPCTECGKRFPSWKALFGHMRCHPERQWRGIKPPLQFRRPLLVAPPGARFTSEEYDVAASLVIMANGPTRDDDGLRARCSGHGLERASCGEASEPRKAPGRKPTRGTAGGDGGNTCSVCCRVFSSRQALGRHVRRHWGRAEERAGSCSSDRGYVLDLNLPPPVEGYEGSSPSVPSPGLSLTLGAF